MRMKQRKLDNAETISVGANVILDLHSKIKLAALREGTSMATIVERAIIYYLENFDEIEKKA